MFKVLLIIIVILSIFLCAVVTIQNSKGGGLAAGFASSNQIMGVRKTTDILEKATWTLVVAIVVLSIISAYVGKSSPVTSDSVMKDAAIESLQVNPETPAVGFDAPVEIEEPSEE